MALERINPDLLRWLEDSTRDRLSQQGKSTDFIEALEKAPVGNPSSDSEHYRGNISVSSGHAVSREEIDRRFSRSFLERIES